MTKRRTTPPCAIQTCPAAGTVPWTFGITVPGASEPIPVEVNVCTDHFHAIARPADAAVRDAMGQ